MQGIAGELRHKRKLLGLSQTEAAIKSGLSLATISRIERGEPTIDPYSIRLYAQAIGIPYEVPASSSGIRPGSLAFSPEFVIACKASHWSEVPDFQFDYDNADERRIVNAGLFILTIDGDCMEPDYPDGCKVQFQIFRIDGEPLVPGVDYVFCRNDGKATFKTLVANDGEIYTLAPLNQARYPGSFTVSAQEVVRMARVVNILMPPRAPGVPRVGKKGTK